MAGWRRIVVTVGMGALLAATPVAAQDDHGNTASSATALSVGTPVGGRIEVAGDFDVFTLRATAGARYTLETGSLTGGMDSLLDLYDPRGQHMQRDDDGGQGYASKLTFSAAQTATYFVVVRHYDRTRGTGGYRLSTSGPASSAPPPPAAPEATPPPTAGSASLTLSTRVYDPKLAGASCEARTQVGGSGTYRATVTVRAGSREVARLVAGAQRSAGRTYADAWDGRAGAAFVAPGAYTVRLDVDRNGTASRTEATVHVVRLGIVQLELRARDRVALRWHRANGRRGSFFDVDDAGAAWSLPRSALGATCLDARDGSPLSLPSPHANVNGPPLTSSGALLERGVSLPMALVQGGRPQALATIGTSAGVGGRAVSVGYPIANTPIRLWVEGGAGPETLSGELRPGTTTIDLPSPTRGVGARTVTYRFRWSYQDGATWRPVPGGQATTHTVYTVLSAPPSGATPWVAAVDAVARLAGGRVTSAEGVADRVVLGVNSTFGLRYDADFGAPAYTDVPSSLQNPELDLDSFLDGRASGRVVNCLDCASLVSALGDQVGVASSIIVIGWNFRLNYLRGIGFSQFTASLFGGQHAFSYHAVASRDRGRTVHDACLSVDDDSRPDRAPHTEGAVTGMTYSHYIDQLSPDRPPVQDVGRVRIRR